MQWKHFRISDCVDNTITTPLLSSTFSRITLHLCICRHSLDAQLMNLLQVQLVVAPLRLPDKGSHLAFIVSGVIIQSKSRFEVRWNVCYVICTWQPSKRWMISWFTFFVNQRIVPSHQRINRKYVDWLITVILHSGYVKSECLHV